MRIDQITGYLHSKYASSLEEFGTPRYLNESGGWVLERQILELPYRDAMGCYPIFACNNWKKIYLDLSAIEDTLVSLTLVTDPFGEYNRELLEQCFDRVIPFKEHFITNLSNDIDKITSKHHKYYSRRAFKHISVERCEPNTIIDDWMRLYEILIKRHNISGMRKFSRRSFIEQMNVPGVVVFRALYQNTTIGAHIWYVQNDVAYSHLEAVDELGYQLMAAYPLYWFAIEWFSNHVQWLDLGAGSGVRGGETDGLSQFKRGWATDKRQVYLCGRIFNKDAYKAAKDARGITTEDYFPSYRKGEFQ